MPKLFYMQFYTRDWLSDPKLRRCSASTKGIWIDLICHMWEDGQTGSFTGDLNEVGRMCGVSRREALEAVMELQKHGVAEVDPPSLNQAHAGEVVIKNRRMMKKNEEKNSKKNSDPNLGLNITLNISDSGSGSDPEEAFTRFYARYPRKAGKTEGKKKFMKLAQDPETLERLNKALDGYIKKLETERVEPFYFLHFSTFMNNWEDYEDYQPPSLRSSVAPNRPPLFDPKNRFAD